MTPRLGGECENAKHFRSEASTRGSFRLKGGILMLSTIDKKQIPLFARNDSLIGKRMRKCAAFSLSSLNPRVIPTKRRNHYAKQLTKNRFLTSLGMPPRLGRECETAAHFRSEASARGSFLLKGGILILSISD